MTGGMIPLTATVATEDIFKAFADDSKLKALLHRHSYSAHPMGCTATVTAIKSSKTQRKSFALELHAGGSDAGYASTYAMSLVQELREEGIYMRPLGNVLYLMFGPCTSPPLCTQLLTKLYRKIDEFHKNLQ